MINFEWYGSEVIAAMLRAALEAEREEAETLRDDTANRSPVGGADDPTAGKLKASWKVIEEDGHVAVASDDPNAIYQEFGTSKMEAQPSLGPASHLAERRWPERLSAHLSVVVREFGGF